MCVYQLQVDKHIRKLDADLARFEAELKVKTLGISSKAQIITATSVIVLTLSVHLSCSRGWTDISVDLRFGIHGQWKGFLGQVER